MDPFEAVKAGRSSSTWVPPFGGRDSQRRVTPPEDHTTNESENTSRPSKFAILASSLKEFGASGNPYPHYVRGRRLTVRIFARKVGNRRQTLTGGIGRAWLPSPAKNGISA